MELKLKQLAEELRATLAKMELALGTITDSVVWTDTAGRIQWCNGAFDQLVGRPHVYVLGCPLNDLLALKTEEEGESSICSPVESALKGKLTNPVVYQFQREGHVQLLEIVGKTIPLDSGEVSVVLSFRDVTERKLFEQKEKELRDQALASAQKEYQRAQELDRAYTELKKIQAMLVQSEKMSAIGQLASGVAHEVQNPLGVLLNCVNYFELSLSQEDKESTEVLATMREAIQRADRIVAGLLHFAKPASPELKKISLEKMVDASLELVSKQMKLAGIRVERFFPEDLPDIRVDENQMQQVLINLFLNAVQAMPQGGTLTLKGYVRPLTLGDKGVGKRSTDKFRPGTAALFCEIKDTGAGIPAENLEKIFYPFFTTKPPGKGTGLGLTLSQSMVEEHGGVLSIQSEEGRGTRATVILPLPS